MCDLCNHSPHLRGCPNEPPPKAIHECVWCGSSILEGQDYYDIDGEPWCENCIKSSRTTAED
ncbi:hypothetical protein [Scatolibacter rhodanostii]|uniref:hypothetical protein n=1 Tax=Scatolibacter rhodanostii TaxID=2014781 RepID=UPI000C072A40|nr:hypothetical protein [Scatolibacter rhodanostii]